MKGSFQEKKHSPVYAIPHIFYTAVSQSQQNWTEKQGHRITQTGRDLTL